MLPLLPWLCPRWSVLALGDCVVGADGAVCSARALQIIAQASSRAIEWPMTLEILWSGSAIVCI